MSENNRSRVWRKTSQPLTRSLGSVLLDVLAFLNELVLVGAGESTLRYGTSLRGEPRSFLEQLSGDGHGVYGLRKVGT